MKKPKKSKKEGVILKIQRHGPTFFGGGGGVKLQLWGGGIIAINRKKFISPHPPPR